jgi:alpha-tubulin suppressor-like RCC1 family protein
MKSTSLLFSLLLLIVFALSGCGGSPPGPSALPDISTGPENQSVATGGMATFTVEVVGSDATYQWQASADGITWADIQGATASTLSVGPVTESDSGKQYRSAISIGGATTYSNVATLQVGAVTSLPLITSQPSSVSVLEPSAASFAVAAIGTPSLQYQWQTSVDGGTTFVDVARATEPSFVTSPTTVGQSGTLLRVRIGNPAGSVFSNSVVLIVGAAAQAPVILNQPENASVAATATATFRVVADGIPSPTFQWQVSLDSGVTFADIGSATNPSYTTAPTVLSDDNKRYRVRVSNSVTSVISSAATLTVTAEVALSAANRLSSSWYHNCVIKTDRTLTCWGGNYNGQLGDGSTVLKSVPTPVPGLTNVAAVATGRAHTCVALADGSVSCWGFKFHVQENGLTKEAHSPVPVPGLANVIALAAGSFHTCALRSNGTVDCWGLNAAGQLGDGTKSVERLTPMQVPGLTGIVAISSGSGHTCALNAVGSVACWGDNANGQTGDGSTASRLTPAVVPGLTGVKEVVAGLFHTCVRNANTTVSCWGANSNGQLGDGTTVRSLVPVVVPGLNNVAGLAVGEDAYHACAFLLDGTARCWGFNYYGQIGDGTAAPAVYSRLSPTVVPGLSGVVAMAVGANHTCVLKTDRTASCWGINQEGQLGIGRTSFGEGRSTVVGGPVF